MCVFVQHDSRVRRVSFSDCKFEVEILDKLADGSCETCLKTLCKMQCAERRGKVLLCIVAGDLNAIMKQKLLSRDDRLLARLCRNMLPPPLFARTLC